MSFADFEADVVGSFFNKTSEFLFGSQKRNNSGEEEEIALASSSTTEDPFFQDTFFHPDLIEDDNDCKVILHVTIGDSLLRVWDLIILIPNVAFLLFLLYQLPNRRSSLQSSPDSQAIKMKTFHSFVVTLSLASALRCFLAIILNLSNPVHDVTNSVIWSIGSLVFLSVELAVAALLVSEDNIRNHQTRRLIAVSCILALALTATQLYFELESPNYGLRVLQTNYQLWSRGGPVFSAALAGSLSLLYTALVLLLLAAPLKQCLHLESSGRILLYLTGLLLLHSLDCLGSVMLSHHVNPGLCLTNISTYFYFTSLPPFLYISFLKSDKFRPNILKNLQFSYSAQYNEEDGENENSSHFSSMQTFILDEEYTRVS